ncbi:intersectin-1-like [Gossypium australe]|uniref:Intersectin-1-like n=1 Tax=Gossypium australe TaxID=47621 RepID=A0A5B6X791_9ROSI|nr:intersectin-1-like [Gossypium australe]
MQEQLAKIQQEMRDQMMDSQRSMMAQLSQLLVGRVYKGKDTMDNIGESNEDPQYPPDFTPTHVQVQPEVNPQRPSVTIRPQQFQTGASIPMNFQAGSSSNNPVVPDLDEVAEVERAKTESQKQLDERCKWLEEKFTVMENADSYHGIDARDLSLVPNLVLPYKFKMPEFEKYNGTTCPEAYITMFYRRMTGYVNNDQLLIHCFQDSLVGAVSKWYNQLSRNKISSWRDIAQAFMKQYSHVTDMTPDKITL